MDELTQAAETIPEGTTPLPTSVETASVSAPADTFERFEAAENAKAVGAEPPVTPPVVAAEPDKSVTAPKPDSKRTERRERRDQDQINETIRRAVAEAIEATEKRLGKPAAEPVAAPVAEFQPTSAKPALVDFETVEAYTEAVAEWVADQREAKRAFEAKKAASEKADTTRREQFETVTSAWIERRDAFTAKHPDKADRLLSFLDNVMAGTPIGDTIMESEVGDRVADYLAEHQPEAERIARLSPIAALRALGKIEAKFDTTDTPTSASATAAGPAAKTVTTAPAPPTTLASRSATPADPTAAAIAAGDFEAFEAAENRKALAAAR